MLFGHKSRHALPRHRVRKAAALVGVGTLIAVGAATGAFADNVQNDVSTPGKLVTVTKADPTGVTVQYQISATSGDSDDTTGRTAQSCNAAVDGSATISLNGLPANVSSAPASLTYTTCGEYKSFVITATASAVAGDYNISANVTDSGAASGDYNTSPGSFVLRVAAPAVADADGDGVVDGSDNCPNAANSDQANNDGDARARRRL
jgi:hypothetical protein